MNGLVFVCILLVADSWAKVAVPVPRHPSEDLIKGAEQLYNSRIIGGSDVTISDNPWQVSLRSIFTGHICGGVILSSTTVLTAAHCVTGGFYSVSYGTGLTSSGSTVQVTNIRSHRDYNPDSTTFAFPNDIAVLTVQEMSLGGNAQAISLTSRSNDELVFASCRITGWGVTDTGSPSTTLKGANMNVLTDSECMETWGGNICPECHICVYGDGERSACNGDSGGPLVCANGNEMELVGVTSWGATNCPANYPSVYTEVRSYTNFVFN
ncbi:fibrinolytic enzyme, isozyme C-like [Pecten maximus]|uniref:fibrinolytic enzyme, isozyme C-like n=1 Tax=Pecten maximus TaxID=6579 RepID=UPI001458048A|nr:fibrinolytic enzyme, isozyme C-like [Pecten maximus]